ncbi:hypothetical protein BDV96DRAFT_92920 [Lophiotrema nucula]|uniref:Uncharacterized protein n=1 Tax=Lophiotrema nucula TaxID=690887 RepID=A0A6A5Z6M0_9PLEO|nr:hypothetical protein BDV96DRAFT_92920 [Lophiotrema nucula]
MRLRHHLRHHHSNTAAACLNGGDSKKFVIYPSSFFGPHLVHGGLGKDLIHSDIGSSLRRRLFLSIYSARSQLERYLYGSFLSIMLLLLLLLVAALRIYTCPFTFVRSKLGLWGSAVCLVFVSILCACGCGTCFYHLSYLAFIDDELKSEWNGRFL